MKNTIQNYNVIFWNITNKYDTTNTNILRKIIHSFSVAEKCFDIASYLGLSKKEREFSYLIGLFHDIGRFEQWKLYKTFFDKKSVDHGDLGTEILQKMPKDIFGLNDRETEIMLNSIKFHTKQYNGDDEKVKFYNEIIKNADAFANIITSANGTHQIFVNENGFSQKILDDFLLQKPLYIYTPITKLDRALMMTANCYYVKFPFLKILLSI